MRKTITFGVSIVSFVNERNKGKMAMYRIAKILVNVIQNAYNLSIKR